VIPRKEPPRYGAFRHGDPAHKGYNKTIGKNWPYIEDPLVDTVKYHPNLSASKSFWRDPTNAISTPVKTIHDNFRNLGKEESAALLRSASEMTTSILKNQMIIASRKKQ
jgi:hypothetical protein